MPAALLGAGGEIRQAAAGDVAGYPETSGLQIRGLGAWTTATVLVWLVTALATLVLPMVVAKAGKDQKSVTA